MKKLIACLLAAAMILACAAPVLAEEAADGLNVAVTTPLTGNFFTAQWGNGTSDTDVRAMIHGYNLITWDAAQGMFVTDPTVVSGLAVTQDPQGNRTYTVALYGDMVYSDGTPITARDYAFSILLALSPEMAQLGGSPRKMPWLVGADAYAAGASRELAGLRVLDDDLLSFTVRHEYLPFFYELGLLDCNPFPIAVIAPGVRVADEGRGAFLTNADGGAQPVFTADLLRATVLDPETGYRTHPAVTSGPYILTSYEDGTAVFDLNPLFKGDANGRKPALRHVTFRAMAQDELIPALEDGFVNLVNKAASSAVIDQGLALTGDGGFASANYNRSGLSFIAFNADRAPAQDPALRQAVAYAMDRDAITEGTVSAYGMRAIGYFGMGQWMYRMLSGAVDYPVPARTEDPAEEAANEQALAAWRALSLDEIEPYLRDEARAAALLNDAGWNLNSAGEPFTPGTDDLRYRMGETGPEPLSLRLAYPTGSAAAQALETVLPENLRAVGIELTVEALPMAELLPQYYHTEPSDYDLFFLATNFELVYDPSAAFELKDGHHVWIATGIGDDALWAETVAMRKTQPGDLLTYCRHWLAFQVRFAEVLPIIPVYSNIYYDFYPQTLQNYDPTMSVSWPQAAIPAFLAQPQTDAEGAAD